LTPRLVAHSPCHIWYW